MDIERIERSVVFIQFLGLYFAVVLTILVVVVVVVLPLLMWFDIIPKPKWWKK